MTDHKIESWELADLAQASHDLRSLDQAKLAIIRGALYASCQALRDEPLSEWAQESVVNLDRALALTGADVVPVGARTDPAQLVDATAKVVVDFATDLARAESAPWTTPKIAILRLLSDLRSALEMNHDD